MLYSSTIFSYCLLSIYFISCSAFIGREKSKFTFGSAHGLYLEGENEDDGMFTIPSLPSMDPQISANSFVVPVDKDVQQDLGMTPENIEDLDTDQHFLFKRGTEPNPSTAGEISNPHVPVFLNSMVPHKEKFLSLPNAPSLEWLEEVVRFHNILREMHGTGKLELDYELSYEAQLWANELGNLSSTAGNVVLKNGVPNNNQKQGENLGARKGNSRAELLNLPGSFPVRVWYSEIANHKWDTNSWQWNAGHFTQLIWDATKRIGCGRVVTEHVCKSGVTTKPPMFLVVCRYTPPGNWLSKLAYSEHVKKPVGRANPNASPNFSKFCPPNSKPCPKPNVCCSENNIAEENSCKSVGRAFNSPAKNKATNKLTMSTTNVPLTRSSTTTTTTMKPTTTKTTTTTVKPTTTTTTKRSPLTIAPVNLGRSFEKPVPPPPIPPPPRPAPPPSPPRPPPKPKKVKAVRE